MEVLKREGDNITVVINKVDLLLMADALAHVAGMDKEEFKTIFDHDREDAKRLVDNVFDSVTGSPSEPPAGGPR